MVIKLFLIGAGKTRNRLGCVATRLVFAVLYEHSSSSKNSLYHITLYCTTQAEKPPRCKRRAVSLRQRTSTYYS